MDANGHRFWMLSDPADFDLSDGTCQFTGHCLHLAGTVPVPDPAGRRARAVNASNLPPVTVGHYDDWAYYDPAHPFESQPGAIMAATNGGPLTPIYGIPEGADLRDMAVDSEGLLRVTGTITPEVSGLIIADLRKRWSTPVVIPLDSTPDRTADKWVLERSSGRLWRETGIGLADLAVRTYADHIFRPDPEYTNPLRLREEAPIELPATASILDCAARSDGLLAVLIVGSAAQKRSRVMFIPPRGRRVLLDVPVPGFASSIGFVSDTRIALTYPGSKRAVVLDTGGDTPVTLSVEPNRTPLTSEAPARLCRGTLQPAHVVHFDEGAPTEPPRALQSLSMPSYRSTGTAPAAQTIIGDTLGTIWHRLVVEADLPAGTGVMLEIQTADREDLLDEAPIHAHYLGDIPVPKGAPQLAWLDAPSELPLQPGLLGKTPIKNRTGCFSGLVQNTQFQSREVAGRFARIRVTLHGKGQATPSIAAIRLYGSRFSLVRNYLPAVMQAPNDPALRETEGEANPLDFYDRYTANFEGLLTRMEDSVVAAPALTDPMAAPPEALDWLAGWIGLTMKSGLNERQRRVMLANGMRLHRRRGTLAGLRLALDIASEGEVGAGGIVALEDFRLRRVFATILGADLGSQFDPLLAGPVESGNSFVGNTLHLGDAAELEGEGGPQLSEQQLTEIAALYRAPTDPDELDKVRSFFAELAWRVTVLVHADVDETRMSLIRDVAQQLTPSHVKLRVERASEPLIVGLYSLLGVDSYLRPRPGATPTILDKTLLGEKDQILSLPSLDPTADYGGTP